jgi:hypothetical protein
MDPLLDLEAVLHDMWLGLPPGSVRVKTFDALGREILADGGESEDAGPHPRAPPSRLRRVANVTAVMRAGSAPVATSHAIRTTRIVVLPLPAGVTHSTGPSGAVAASRSSGARRSSRSVTDE